MHYTNDNSNNNNNNNNDDDDDDDDNKVLWRGDEKEKKLKNYILSLLI